MKSKANTECLKISFQNFLPAYIAAPAVRELPSAVLSAVNAFVIRHPDVQYSPNFPRLVGLVTHLDDHFGISTKEGELLESFLSSSLLDALLFCLFVP